MPISFYRVSAPYGCFSNFSLHPIYVRGRVWRTSEHYFQAQKFAGTPHEDELRDIMKPAAVAIAGRDRSRPLRTDWEGVKDNVMREALLAKFIQNEDDAGEPIIHDSMSRGCMSADTVGTVLRTRNLPWTSWSRRPTHLVEVLAGIRKILVRSTACKVM